MFTILRDLSMVYKKLLILPRKLSKDDGYVNLNGDIAAKCTTNMHDIPYMHSVEVS